jgi:hypothetical protein
MRAGPWFRWRLTLSHVRVPQALKTCKHLVHSPQSTFRLEVSYEFILWYSFHCGSASSTPVNGSNVSAVRGV